MTTLQRGYAQQLGANFVADVVSGHLPILTHPEDVVAAAHDLAKS